MKSKALLFSSLIAIALVASPAFAQQVVEWDDMNASANGSGCSSWDTFFIATGNQVTAIFSQLGIDLTGTWDDSNTAKKTCTIVIPAKVRKGFYVGKLRQTMFYGYSRSDYTAGKVSYVSRFFGYYAGSAMRPVPTPGFDRYNEPYVEATSERMFGVLDPSFCTSPDPYYSGNFVNVLTVTGQRKNRSHDIVIQIDGEDIKFSAVGIAFPCP